MFCKNILRFVRENLPSIIALAICALLGVWLFRNHNIGWSNYIGNFDRLNAYLNVQHYMMDAVHRQGSPESWCDQLFLGVNLFGQAGVTPDPIFMLLSCFSQTNFIWYSGVISCALFILSGWSAYFMLRKLCLEVVPALIGALLYEFSYCSIFVMSNMTAYAIMIFLPLILVCLHEAVKKTSRWPFPVLTFSLVYLSAFGHMQFTLYAYIAVAIYSVFLSCTSKSFRPMITGLLAGVIAVATCAPRLVTVASEMALVGRGTAVSFADTYQFNGVYPREWLRWISGGIFGRCPSEAQIMGNAINLNEGMWIYTSIMAALLVVFGLLRFQGKWFGLMRQKNWDLRFHVVIFVTASAIVIWPAARFLCYTLFLKLNIFHPRIIVMALISVVVIISFLIKELIPESFKLTARNRFICIFIALVCGFGLHIGINKMTDRTGDPEKIAMETSPWNLADASIQFLLKGSAMPSSLQSPQNLRAFTADNRSVVVEWDPVIGASHYEFFVMLNHAPVSQMRWNGTRIVINDLDQNAGYTITVRSAFRDQLSPYAEAVQVLPADSSDIAKLSDPMRSLTTWMSSRELMRIEWSGIALLCTFGLIHLKKRSTGFRWIAAHSVSFAMVFQALSFADFQVNGPQVKSEYPFDRDNFFAAKGDEYRIPADDTLKEFHDQLEVDRFRSVVVCDPDVLPAFSASYFAMFWKLRIAEGYISGVPERIRSLPWPPQTTGYRTVQFNSAASLSWPLLSLLNVKYALVATNAWHRNAGTGADGSRTDVKPWDIEILMNPGPPAPREFFVQNVVPVPDAKTAVLNMFPGGLLADKIPQVSAVSYAEQWEGIAAARFATSAPPQANYRGGTVELKFTSVNEPRFLVLNELYHPDWRAYIDNESVKIYPTNAYMRGVVVPAGASQVTFQFEPCFRLRNLCLSVTLGAILFAVSMVYLPRVPAGG